MISAILTILLTLSDPALWLARSCVGEAGWRSIETGECAAIGYVYRKRAKRSGSTYLDVLRRYSSAVGPYGRRWVRSLSRDLRRPHGWPRALKWGEHTERWHNVLAYTDAFERGELNDPTPRALHYGGWLDLHRLDPSQWQRMKLPKFKNFFYMKRR